MPRPRPRRYYRPPSQMPEPTRRAFVFWCGVLTGILLNASFTIIAWLALR